MNSKLSLFPYLVGCEYPEESSHGAADTPDPENPFESPESGRANISSFEKRLLVALSTLGGAGAGKGSGFSVDARWRSASRIATRTSRLSMMWLA